MRRFTALIIARTVKLVLKVTGKGSGSALPGLFAQKIDPNLLTSLLKQIPEVIVVTGTNGKTTTVSFLKNILSSSGKKLIVNSTGSNMQRGLLSELISHVTFAGKMQAEMAVFEVEEATLPKIIRNLNCKIIIVTNVFRDQLDAYGEVDRTVKFISESIEDAPGARVIINNDDPKLQKIVQKYLKRTVTFGIDPQESKKFRYEGSHKSSSAALTASKIKINHDLSTSFKLESQQLSIQPPGIYNVYNALAAIGAARLSGVKAVDIKNGLEKTRPAFGRGEVIVKDKINYRLMLMKNPAGADQSLSLLAAASAQNLLLILNDRVADGRDVSWIWDADFEKINASGVKSIVCSGTRAEDMLLRIKYIMSSPETNDENAITDRKTRLTARLSNDFEEIHKQYKKDGIKNVFVMPTYTAMLAFRKYLSGENF